MFFLFYFVLCCSSLREFIFIIPLKYADEDGHNNNESELVTFILLQHKHIYNML